MVFPFNIRRNQLNMERLNAAHNSEVEAIMRQRQRRPRPRSRKEPTTAARQPDQAQEDAPIETEAKSGRKQKKHEELTPKTAYKLACTGKSEGACDKGFHTLISFAEGGNPERDRLLLTLALALLVAAALKVVGALLITAMLILPAAAARPLAKTPEAMVLAAALFGFLGYRRVKKLRKPEKTIDSLKQASTVLPNQHDSIPGVPGYKK